MKKRLCSSLLCLAMATSLLMGCSSGQSANSTSGTSEASKSGSGETASKTAENQGGSSNAEPITLHFWTGLGASADASHQKIIDEFNELYKDQGITVEFENFVNDSNGNLKLETNLLGGSEIDCYMTYGLSALTKRAEGNLALDLSELCERDGFDIVASTSSMAEAYYVDGKPYSLPTKLDQYGMVLNKDMFDAAGIEIPTSWTYEEFLEICKQLTHGEGQDKVYGMFWNTGQDRSGYVKYLACQTLGGDNYYTEDGTATIFDDPVWQKTIELAVTTMKEGYAPSHADTVTEKLNMASLFAEGKIAMCEGPWLINSLKDTSTYPHDFVTAFAPYPVIDEASRFYTQGGYGDMICINPRSEHIDAAWEFAKFYMTKGALYMAERGRIPSYNALDKEAVATAVLTDAEGMFDSETMINVLIEPHDNYAYSTITTKMPEIQDIFYEELEAIWMEQKTVEEGLADAKQRSDTILSK